MQKKVFLGLILGLRHGPLKGFSLLPEGDSMTHEVFIVDDYHPEDMAMLQALYSRSPASVVKHIDKLKKAGSG